MRRIYLILSILAFSLLSPAGDGAGGGTGTAKGPEPSAGDILARLAQRYEGRNFTAEFRQQSTLKAMDITDTATGRAWFKHPGMMRWEYETPRRHVILTDGNTLWIYRPADNQVVIGDAGQYFGTGKGASFLADFGLLQEAFEVSAGGGTDADRYRLKLTPREKELDLAVVYLEVNKETLDIEQVTTENVYGDVTRIFFENLEFRPEMKNRLFRFQTPEGADVIQMEP